MFSTTGPLATPATGVVRLRYQPGVRQMASVQLHTVDDIDATLFTDWLRQAYELEVK
ncbi:hypothetical protein [Microtetraspora malaysiensis]|uniref:DUF5655 domain-containing protein n=1 Tax=Microtetraspora malaysiensis TaxID=161358 RepID=A0ABW6T6P0_9ACTN